MLLYLGETGAFQLRNFNRVYRTCLKNKVTQGRFDAFRTEMESLTALAQKLSQEERERVLAEIYERYQVVAFRMDAIDSFMADALRKSAKALPNNVKKRAEALLRQRIAAIKAQTAADISKLTEKAKVGRLSQLEAELLKDLRKFKRLVQFSDTEVWHPIMKYLSDNGAKMQRATNGLSRKQAMKALEGYRSKLKGLLGEPYSLRSPAWIARRRRHLREAWKAAKRLGPDYEVIKVAGEIKLNSKETWDEVILIVKKAGRAGEAPEAIVHTAAQTKVEKQISAVEQILQDRLRESGLSIYQPSLLEITGQKVAFVIRPNPEGISAFRYILHAQGGRLSKKSAQRLADAGIAVDKLELDMTIEQFNRLADHLINSSLKVDFTKIAIP